MSGTTVLTHALLDIEETKPKSWEHFPDYVAVCACGRRGPRCMFRENAIADHEQHEKDPGAA